jgi:hypothetical protein
VVSYKWLYKIKHATDGSIENIKVRFVVRGFSKKDKVEYEDTFTPISRYTSIRVVMSLSSIIRWM